MNFPEKNYTWECIDIASCILAIAYLQEQFHSYFLCPCRFVGLEFIREKVAKGALPVLQQHPRYGCVKCIATLHPELKDTENQVIYSYKL